MSEPIELRPLRGRNPRGFLAALGALDVATRALPEVRVTLAWTAAFEPVAVLQGPRDAEHLVELCENDRQRWVTSPVLAWDPDGNLATDLKVPPRDVGRWFRAALASGERADTDLLAALLAEGAVSSGKKDSKPTHLHFTAGQQKFLTKVRELRVASDAAALREALTGPWRYESVRGLGWDTGSERIRAYRAIAPTDDTANGVPGADWLAFLGLRFFPVAAKGVRLMTTGCSGRPKHELFTWPLWNVPVPAAVVAALVGRGDLAAMTAADRHALGVHHVLRAPIRRSDPGGLGSFGAPDAVSREEERDDW